MLKTDNFTAEFSLQSVSSLILQFLGSTEFPKQKMGPISQRVPELESEIQTKKQGLLLYIYRYLEKVESSMYANINLIINI